MSLGEDPDRPQVNFEEIRDDFGNGSPVEVDTEVLAELVAQLLDLAELLDGSGASKVLQLAHKIYDDADEAFRRNVDDFRHMIGIGPREPEALDEFGTNETNGGLSSPRTSVYIYHEFDLDTDTSRNEPPSIDGPDL